jgi:hypothetical protein
MKGETPVGKRSAQSYLSGLSEETVVQMQWTEKMLGKKCRHVDDQALVGPSVGTQRGRDGCDMRWCLVFGVVGEESSGFGLESMRTTMA